MQSSIVYAIRLWYTVDTERGGQEAPQGGPRVGPGGRGHLENCIADFVDIILSVQPAATACSIAGRIDERRIIANTIPSGTRKGKRQGRAKGTTSDRNNRPTGADEPAHKKINKEATQ